MSDISSDCAPIKPMEVAAVAALTLFWAFNWPMMKLALATVDPWTFRAFLVIGGGLGCAAVALASGVSLRLPRAEWPAMLGVGVLQGALWNGFSGFGISMVDAGRAAVLAFTMPLWATLLSIVFLSEAVTARRFGGLAIGMVGMALLLLPALGAMGSALGGTLLMLAAAISWAGSTVLFKGAAMTSHIVAISVWQYVIGAIPLTIAAVALGEPSSLLDVRGGVLAAVAYSALVPMVFCQVVWFTVVRRLPASYASMGTLMVPVLGVMFSAAVLAETVGPAELAALVCVTVAMALVLPGISSQASRRPPPGSRPG